MLCPTFTYNAKKLSCYLFVHPVLGDSSSFPCHQHYDDYLSELPTINKLGDAHVLLWDINKNIQHTYSSGPKADSYLLQE